MAAIRRLVGLLQPEKLKGRVTLVPVVNEDAFGRGQRTASDGLDLARTCPGRPDGSITERIAHALTRLIRSSDYYIDLHTGGTALTIYPLAGYTLHPDSRILEIQRAMARALNLPIVWGTSADLEGRSLSVARDAHVPAIYAEYGGGGGCNPKGVEAYVDGCLNVMAELGMIEREPPPYRIEHMVEDARRGSGHMQVQNAAPCAGYFEPAVTLGARVETGDLLGTVTDPLGEEVTPMRSVQRGIALVLRSFPRVEAGDSLGVVLELPYEQ